jgi:hypothetical protein
MKFLENEVCELMQAVSHAYVRRRFKNLCRFKPIEIGLLGGAA